MKETRTIHFTLIVLGMLAIFSVSAQECVYYYPHSKGTEVEITSYDKKGKISSITSQKVIDIKETSNGLTTVLESKIKDKKGQQINGFLIEAFCKGDEFMFSMDGYLSSQNMEAYQEMDVEVEADNLVFPSKMKAGDNLGGGSIKVKISNAGMKIMSLTVNINDRTVEGIENITTSAGTFECYKISYTIETKMFVSVKMKATEWFAKDIGMVKSESFNSSGKFMGHSELTKITR